MLKLSPTAFGCSSASRVPVDHVVHVAPGADLRAVAVDRQVAAGERRLDERADRPAADLARAVDVERPDRRRRQAELGVVRVRHVLAGELGDGVGPARLADGAARRDVRLVHVERVRAEDLARREVDEALDRLLRRRAPASRALNVPTMFTRIVRTGLSSTVSTPAIPAQWTRCVAPANHVREPGRRRARRPGRSEVRVVGERRAAERVAVEVVDGDDLVLVDEPARASCR